MPPKSKQAPKTVGSPPTKEATDPMLQDTYVQDDATDFEHPVDEIAAFEERLNHPHRAGGNSTVAQVSEPHRRSTAPARGGVQHPPRASPPSSMAMATPPTDTRRLPDRRLSEEEQVAEKEHVEEIDDVRHLEDRFGHAADDDDSDEETVARRRKLGR